MAGLRVGGKPLSEPSINTLHKCIYIYTPSSLDLLQGALTHGDRRATESRFNIENKYGPQDCDEINPWTGNSSSATQAISLKVRDIHCCKRLKY